MTADHPTFTVAPGPRNARSDPESGLRYYTWQGVEYPSVTSIRRIAGMPHNIHQGAVKKVVTRATEEFPTLAAMMTREPRHRERVVDKNRISETGKWLRAAATEHRDAAASLGTAVHDAAAEGKRPEDIPDTVSFVKDGKPVEVPGSEVRPRLTAYRDWLRVSGAEVVASEFQCWNLTAGYAGSADLLVRFPAGQLYLVDIKTGSGVYAEHLLQVMAYANAEFIGSDDVVDETLTDLLPRIDGVAVLHIGADGWEFLGLDATDEAWGAFLGLLSFARWMSEHPDMDNVVRFRKRSAVVCFACQQDITDEEPQWISPSSGRTEGRTTMPHHLECALRVSTKDAA